MKIHFENCFKPHHTNLFQMLSPRLLVLVVSCAICVCSVSAVSAETRLVTVVDGEDAVTLLTMESDNEEILEDVGVELDSLDRLDEDKQSGNAVTLEVRRAMRVKVTTDGRTRTVVLHEGTVGDALSAASVTVGKQDLCNLTAEFPLIDGLNITVRRVTAEETEETEPVDFEEEKKDDPELLKGKTKVVQEGAAGERTIVTKHTLIDGKEVSSEVLSDSVTKEPQNRIIAVGTKEEEKKAEPKKATVKKNSPSADKNAVTKKSIPKANGNDTIGTNRVPGSASWRAQVKADGTLIDHLGNTVSYTGMLSGRATAYYAKAGAKTSTGRLAQYGVVAVDPRIIPYGTKLYICSPNGKTVYGYAVAGDTGGALLSGIIAVDLYYNNIEQCYWFGSRQMNVYIIG